MNKKKKVSMQDIADALGVSKFSVSVAISDSYGVSEDLRLKILVKAMEMGYDFGRNNKRKNRKNNTVTLLVGGVEKAESIFWSSLIRSIEKTLVNENFDFSILIISNYETPKEMVARIYENHSVGVILISDCSEEIMMEIENLKIPAVIVDSAGYLSLKHNFISADNYAAGMFAAQTFIGLGHRDIAFVGEKRYAYSFAER